MITWAFKGKVQVSELELSVLATASCVQCEGKGFVERDRRWFACWCARRARFNSCYNRYVELGARSPSPEVGRIEEVRADFMNMVRRALTPETAREFFLLLHRQIKGLTSSAENAKINTMKAIAGSALAEGNWGKE